MSVVASDIVVYGTQNMPQDDLSTAGGAINSGIRVVFDDIQLNSIIYSSSSSASDSGNLSVTGRDAAGILISESIGLSGTSTVSGSQVFERIIACSVDTVAVGDISVSGGIPSGVPTKTSIGTIYSNESGFQRIFYDATANSLGGSDKTLYEKVFVKNNNSTTALQAATITEVSNGLYNIITFGLEKSLNYDESVANRLNAPTGVTSYGDGASGVAGSNLTALDAQGVWVKLFLANGSSSQNSFYRLQVEGTTV